MELNRVPLMGKAESGGMFWDVCELNAILDSVSSNG